MPMPLDVKVTYTDGSTEDFHIPLRMMYGHKPTSATVLDDWSWVQPSFDFTTKKEIRSVEIDTDQQMADIKRENNSKTIDLEKIKG